MIQNGTFLNVIDNSGAKQVYCIKILTGYRKRYATVGDVIVVSIKSLRIKRRLTSKIKKGTVAKALIVRTKIPVLSYSCESIGFLENSVILLNSKNKLLGTRIFGVIPKILRYTKFLRVVSLSSGLVV